MNYTHLFIEKYSTGQPVKTKLADDQIVICEDHDGNYYVYECDSDELAHDIAKWFRVAADEESNCDFYDLNKLADRHYFLEVNSL